MSHLATSPRSSEPCTSINVLTLNCWGLKFISKYRRERLGEIGRMIARHVPPLDIAGLQEVWTFEDYQSVRQQTRSILPHGKFYNSGVFGGGLVILSKWPIEDSSMLRYPLNGRPTAFFRGDWFVGKGVACATVRMPDGQLLEVFNTHLHAPYEREPNDSYLCHRTAQAWEIAKLMRKSRAGGNLVLGLGDFNMVPMSFAHELIEARGGVRDVWRVLKPNSSIGASIDEPEIERRRKAGARPQPDVDESLNEHGHTCDSVLNTWRWSKQHQKELFKGTDRQVSSTDADPKAKRLDYIFFGGFDRGWFVKEAKVVMTERHHSLRCSVSDHFAVAATIIKAPRGPMLRGTGMSTEGEDNLRNLEKDDDSTVPIVGLLAPSVYEDVLAMISGYTLRERKQRRWRTSHFIVWAVISIGCFIAIWWSPKHYVSFLLILLSTLGLMYGTVDGLIGLLFMGWELRALGEFEWEVRNALQLAGGMLNEESPVRDWYDK